MLYSCIRMATMGYVIYGVKTRRIHRKHPKTLRPNLLLQRRWFYCGFYDRPECRTQFIGAIVSQSQPPYHPCRSVGVPVCRRYDNYFIALR